ncbi:MULTISPECIES: hypothetical protein [Leisingera]|uniref:Uncharacterized protein n=1 Tax=Leisingera aquaemixtae TaxID=1396826 RepID=A0ABY5WPM5_9RHOB|nr:MULTISPECIES: hypothetical protein [Leisingera]QDI76728.1 hypothetical protein R2C4_13580 [Leisingera aquaemixtae]UWQ26803.1 hypothetical protein K3553_03725 [Leisingera aquaemixtae]UWQ43470.1 hypothetical protein K3718_03765 [Leisingera aquaemixtae]
MPDYGGNPMNPVNLQQDPKDKARQAALEALEQAFAYYTPEPLPAAAEPSAVDGVVEYYQAA